MALLLSRGPAEAQLKAAADTHPEPGVELIEVPVPEPQVDHQWYYQRARWEDTLPRVMGDEFAGEFASFSPHDGVPRL